MWGAHVGDKRAAMLDWTTNMGEHATCNLAHAAQTIRTFNYTSNFEKGVGGVVPRLPARSSRIEDSLTSLKSPPPPSPRRRCFACDRPSHMKWGPFGMRV